MFINLEVEVFKNEEGKLMIFLANDGSSGVKYEVETKQDIINEVSSYVEGLLEDVDLDNIETDEEE